MAKKVLILESSTTIQTLFSKSLDSKKYSLKFEADGDKVFTALLDFKPDIFLINCDIAQPITISEREMINLC